MSTLPTIGLPNTAAGNLATTRLITIPVITAVGTRLPYVVYYDKPFDLINFTSTTTNYGTYFTLVTPLTSRQPLFTANAPFLNGLITRVWFFQFYRRPQIISLDGSSDPTSLLQLDNPISKVNFPDIVSTSISKDISDIADQDILASASMADPTVTYPIAYGATSTLTISTSLTANPGEVVYLQFPSATKSQAIEYTTLLIPTDPDLKQFPNGQPILVLTQVEGILINSASSTFSTATIVQAPSPQPTSDPANGKLILVDPLYNYSTWSRGERIGVIIAAVATFIAVVFLLAYMRRIAKRRRRRQKDAERTLQEPSPDPIPR